MSDPGLPDSGALPVAVAEPEVPTYTAIQGRSLGQIAWRRLKRDRVAMVGAGVVVFLIIVAIFAPLIVDWFGTPPNDPHRELIDEAGGTLAPIGPWGGMSWDHLMGVEPQSGRDIFSRIVYGSRISLLIAFLATLLSVASSICGAVYNIVTRKVGGRDRARRAPHPASGAGTPGPDGPRPCSGRPTRPGCR